MRRGRTATAGGTAPARRARGTVLRAGIVIGASCALLQAPVPVTAAPPARPVSYQTDPEAERITGSPSARAGGPSLEPGKTYLDTISPGDLKFYRVTLDDTSNAYISAVLAPGPGNRAVASDGIRVSLFAPNGAECSDSNDIVFGGSTPLPAADYSTRRIGPGRDCQKKGQYLYSVEWIGSADTPAVQEFPVELKYMAEPGLKDDSPTPSASVTWHSHAPEHVGGAARDAEGGSGFNDATAIGHGIWRDRLKAGESVFYRVPVDWGQQLFVDAEFGGGATPGRTVYEGARITVFNTARGFVENADADHRSRTTRVSLDTVPVAFANRTSDQDETSAMRFAGWYYLRVSTDRRMPGTTPVTLRVGVEGTPGTAPPYESDPFRQGFGVADEDRITAGAQPAHAAPDDDDTREAVLTLIGIAGIGTGTVLVLGLAGWTALARLGMGRKRGRHAST
ncbi:hypothetical protein [Streptomyces yaizuensis]|uniref:PT domain-containing protein n=1 Tax=Streptomyces yaizuensis TaxID=2989713 RepID=A0ABQ5NWM0_9ACTN|nr:hypothetical protein [Streptomyces sp. YSPA8]GLF94386.1 PT domain-containing protein [Streptomyces sp. YSPA8]